MTFGQLPSFPPYAVNFVDEYYEHMLIIDLSCNDESKTKFMLVDKNREYVSAQKCAETGI